MISVDFYDSISSCVLANSTTKSLDVFLHPSVHCTGCDRKKFCLNLTPRLDQCVIIGCSVCLTEKNCGRARGIVYEIFAQRERSTKKELAVWRQILWSPDPYTEFQTQWEAFYS